MLFSLEFNGEVGGDGDEKFGVNPREKGTANGIQHLHHSNDVPLTSNHNTPQRRHLAAPAPAAAAIDRHPAAAAIEAVTVQKQSRGDTIYAAKEKEEDRPETHKNSTSSSSSSSSRDRGPLVLPGSQRRGPQGFAWLRDAWWMSRLQRGYPSM